MARAQDDRKGEGEQDEQDEQRDGDAEAAARLGSVGRGGQRRRRLGGLTAGIAREHVLLVHVERACIRPQEAAHEHIRRQTRDLVRLQLMEDAHGDPGGLSELRHRNLPLLPFPL